MQSKLDVWICISPICYWTVGTQALCYVKINKINKNVRRAFDDLTCFIVILILPLLQSLRAMYWIKPLHLFVRPPVCGHYFGHACCTNGCMDFYEYLYTHYSPSGDVHIDWIIIIHFTDFFLSFYTFFVLYKQEIVIKKENFDLNKVVLIVIHNSFYLLFFFYPFSYMLNIWLESCVLIFSVNKGKVKGLFIENTKILSKILD